MKTEDKFKEFFDRIAPHIKGHTKAIDLFWDGVNDVELFYKKINDLKYQTESKEKELKQCLIDKYHFEANLEIAEKELFDFKALVKQYCVALCNVIDPLRANQPPTKESVEEYERIGNELVKQLNPNA